MDKVLFEKAVKLDRDINILKKIQDDIEKSSFSHLNWCGNRYEDKPILSEFQMDFIKDILKKHDMMMREEIHNEINRLENKIKML